MRFACKQHIIGRRFTSTAEALVKLGPIGPPERDFAFRLASGTAQLNHASFGAPPLPVQAVEARVRAAWNAAPDEWYFGGRLDAQMMHATAAAAAALSAPVSEVALVGNATDAAMAVALRWGEALRREAGAAAAAPATVLTLDAGYASNHLILRHTCCGAGGGAGGGAGARLALAHVPFPLRAEAEVLEELRKALARHRPRFVLLEHVLSQPALVLPVRAMVALCREAGCVQEVAVDAAHAFMLDELDVPALGADWWWANLHKWGQAPATATAVWAPARALRATRHPIVSWRVGEGLQAEAGFTGTRDFAPVLAVPAALEYRRRWRARGHAGGGEGGGEGAGTGGGGRGGLE
eukprot:g189.t1